MACTEQRDIKYFWLLDSYSRDPKGHRATRRGVSFCTRFVSAEELYKNLRRNLRITKGSDQNVTPVTR